MLKHRKCFMVRVFIKEEMYGHRFVAKIKFYLMVQLMQRKMCTDCIFCI